EVSPAGVDAHVAADGPAEERQRLQERPDEGLKLRIVRGRGQEHADAPHPLALLRARRERPRGHRAAEQLDELAPTDHSITSSARARSIGLFHSIPALIDSALCCLVLCETSSRGRLTKMPPARGLPWSRPFAGHRSDISPQTS